MIKEFRCRKCQARNWVVCWSYSDYILFAVAIAILIAGLVWDITGCP